MTDSSAADCVVPPQSRLAARAAAVRRIEPFVTEFEKIRWTFSRALEQNTA
jgi:hypothetical protein